MGGVRLGIIGLGRWAEWYLQVIATMDEVSVSAVCSRTRERVGEIAQRFSVPNTYSSFNALVQDTAVDAIVVATEMDRHCEPTLAAIDAGKPVLVEKPIAGNLEDADRMVQAAREANVILLPGHILRFDKRYVAVKDLIAEGQLGRLASIFARRAIPREFITYRPRPLIVHLSVHDIDIILWYLGERPSEVYCMQGNLSNASVPDTNWILLRFPSGAIASVEATGLVPDDAPSQVIADMEITGTKGIAKIHRPEHGLTLWTDELSRKPDLSIRAMVAGRVVGSLRNELRYFAECVTQAKRPEIVTPEESRDALRVCLMALRSAESHESIKYREQTSDP